jgi:hypothetical protein
VFREVSWRCNERGRERSRDGPGGRRASGRRQVRDGLRGRRADRDRESHVMRPIAALLALVAVACLVVVIADMVRRDDSAARGWILRVVAVGCFAAAVVLNVLAR